MLKTGNKIGFTLVEVLAAAAVLSLGIVMIYESYFISLDSFNYYENYLSVSPWMDEKIWQAQDAVYRLGPQAQIDKSGEFQGANNTYKWDLVLINIDEEQGLCRLDLLLSWKEGERAVKLSRNAYARYAQKE
jgi:prepilin-type N-terminal cleavage/methylation domain-containing protein